MTAPVPPLGTLTDRVTLQRKMTTSEPEGGEVAVFATLATVWARVRLLRTRQAYLGDARGQAATHGVVVRFRTDLQPGDRIVYRGRNLAVEAVADMNGRRVYLSCQCVEQAVTG
ncbi:MAG TPA: phage head closure protein [Devosia sp.]|jgi:SPP1 family predicted phage head-tail adaptor|nr:phage head closure protein [Devosia sp.]